MTRTAPDQALVAALAGNLHLRGTPHLDAPGAERPTVAASVCAALAAAAPELLRLSTGTTVLATREHVVRVAEPNRSSIDVTRIIDAAITLRASGVPTPEPLARLVVTDPGTSTWEVSVWRRYRNDLAPNWERLGALLGALHAVDPAPLGALPPFLDTLTRGRRRVEQYDWELPGLLRCWEQLAAPLYEHTACGVVHGDMTLGNVLWGHDVLMCDLEALCTGPREWDLAKLHETVTATHGPGAFTSVLRGYPHTVDHAVLAACIAANRVKTTTWQLAECDAGAPSAPRAELVATLAASITATRT